MAEIRVFLAALNAFGAGIAYEVYRDTCPILNPCSSFSINKAGDCLLLVLVFSGSVTYVLGMSHVWTSLLGQLCKLTEGKASCYTLFYFFD